MAATRNYARHLRVITVLQTKSRQLRNLITLTKCAIILKQILGINLSMLVCLLDLVVATAVQFRPVFTCLASFRIVLRCSDARTRVLNVYVR
jgi:hypothetical protein